MASMWTLAGCLSLHPASNPHPRPLSSSPHPRLDTSSTRSTSSTGTCSTWARRPGRGPGRAASASQLFPHWTVLAVAVAVYFTSGSAGVPEVQQVVRGVRVKQGDIAGLLRTTDNGFKYVSFRGIPYAAPPVGELRFKSPKEPQSWAPRELEAFKDGTNCMQVKDTKFKLWGLLGFNRSLADWLLLVTSLPRLVSTFLAMQESEDCLFLNVYTPVRLPVLPSEEHRPVLVFVHGGGFLRGSANSAIYGPDFLVEQGMVVVTLNYRLGSFGFLSTNTSDAPGNAGLKDQTMALRWVRDNIHFFGGDPKRVTIYGESAGGASVHLHVLSPMSRGLFHAAIMSSSTVLSTYVMTDDPVEHSELLARNLGAPEEVIADPRRRVQYLREQDRFAVARKYANSLTEEDSRQIITKLPFGAVVEDCGDGEEHFLCENPVDILESGRYNKVPTMFGFNQNEGTLIYALDSAKEILGKLESDVTTLVPSNLLGRVQGADRERLGRRIKEFYIRPEDPSDLGALLKLYGDIQIAHGVLVAARWHARHSTPATPVYLYRFTHDAFGFYKFLYGIRAIKGPGHADELGCVFNFGGILNNKFTPNLSRQKQCRMKMTKLISNFAKHKNPIIEEEREIFGTQWPAATRSAFSYLDFNETLQIKTDPISDRMKFWDSAYREATHAAIYE
ncbi:juvenile hormone esterase-like isoform X2 [Thrips palmi]|uniref:Carboxylic ester hydrolase n=1 Tax=Thrips palmi TaxID=161013 RepID=A0A6P8YK99_THRPL|nr:juvenile hormone esterase-like isoform X2 [Thrips palmi]